MGLKELRQIRNELGKKGLRLHARLEAVKAIDDALSECPAELRDLLGAVRELTLAGAPARTVLPLWDRYRNALGKDGAKPKPLFVRSHLTALTAAVDVIAKGRRGVDSVVAEVAKAAGVSYKELKSHRLRCQREGINLGDAYNCALTEF